jgi:hypothetical protein
LIRMQQPITHTMVTLRVSMLMIVFHPRILQRLNPQREVPQRPLKSITLR